MSTAGREALVLVVVAMALAAVVYLNALHAPFVWDDYLVVVHNRALETPWRLDGALALGGFRPVTALSYAVDRAIWKLEPFGYHLTSLLLHVVNAGLVALLVLALAADRDRRAGATGDGRDGPILAFAVAAIVAVHPALSQAVDYVSARSEVLGAALFLGAFLALRGALLTGRATSALAGVALFVLAAAAREVALALPFVLLVYDRVFLDGSPETRRRRLGRWHAPLIAATLVAGALRLAVYVRHEGGALDAVAGYAFTQAGVVWRYLVLLAAPVNLSLVHHVPPAIAGDPRALLAAAGVVALGAGAMAVRRVAPLVTLGVAWFLLALLPTSVVPLRDPMLEHRLYLASVGAVLAIAAGLAAIAERVPADPRRRHAVAAALIVVVVGILGAVTMMRNRVWADPLELWQDAVDKAPASGTAHAGFADALARAGMCDAAIPEFEVALGLEPDAGTATNLATCLIAERRPAEALAAFQRALALDPKSAAAHHNLALLALRRGDREVAHRHFLQAIAPDWRRPRWREDLIALHEQSIGDPAKTLELCRELLRTGSDSAGVRECIARNEARVGKRPASG